MSQPEEIQNGAATESLADLPLTEEQSDETNGGSSLIEGQLWGEGKKVTIDFCK